jgi:hypothetical protein
MTRIQPFGDGDTSTAFRNHLDKALREIDAIENEYVLKASPTELEEHFNQQARVEPLRLCEHYIENQRGVQIDVSRDFRRGIMRGERAHVSGTQVDVAIPYEGDGLLWKLRPSTYGLGEYPDLVVYDDRVVASFTFPDDSANAVELKQRVEDQLGRLKSTVETLGKDVERHNASIAVAVKERLAGKRQKAEAALAAVSSLGIPMKRRDQPETYVVPTKRRASPIRRPAVTGEKYAPEPVFDDKEYEFTLSVLRSMSLVIERNPESFRSLDEEAIRDHFLLQLNGHYEGGATGETFNRSGKTDILIRAGDRNVFIAECKFWGGQKRFAEAIDQLLSYLTWRDCKCALLVFNRTKDSAGVRQKMHEVMTQRPEQRKTVSTSVDCDSRYIFVKTSEPGREILISTQLFDVPSE